MNNNKIYARRAMKINIKNTEKLNSEIKKADIVKDVMAGKDFNVISNEKQGDEWYAEIEYYSPAGEDFVFTIFYDNTTLDFIDAFYKYALYFDVDEHAEEWIAMRGQNGVPNTIEELIEDAKAIREALSDMAVTLDAMRQGD